MYYNQYNIIINNEIEEYQQVTTMLTTITITAIIYFNKTHVVTLL